MLGGDVVNELHDNDRLADAGTPEEARLTTLQIRCDEIDDLDAGLEDLAGRNEVLQLDRRPMDRPAFLGVHRPLLVYGLTHHVDDPAQHRVTDGRRDGATGIDDLHAADDAVGDIHRYGADLAPPQVLLDLADDVDRRFAVTLYPYRGVYLRQLLGLELDVDDRSDDLYNLAYVVSHCRSLRFFY